nr:HD domain-containing protein [Micromonospora sp. DSM 115978]
SAPELFGVGEWEDAQAQLFDGLTARLGVAGRLDAWREVRLPAQAQMVLSGWVVLSDWLASSEPLLGDAAGTYADYATHAERRAERAAELAGWSRLWTPAEVPADVGELYRARFDRSPRGVQTAGVEVAWSVPGPSLFVVEAPTGEGKTELALAVAEVMAWRFGARGLFLGLPTQATADQMFTRVGEWLVRA